MYVFGLGEETGILWEPMKPAPKAPCFKPQTFLLWGISVSHKVTEYDTVYISISLCQQATTAVIVPWRMEVVNRGDVKQKLQVHSFNLTVIETWRQIETTQTDWQRSVQALYLHADVVVCSHHVVQSRKLVYHQFKDFCSTMAKKNGNFYFFLKKL